MSVIFRLPPINPIKFAEADLEIPDKWGYPSFGRALQADSGKKHQVREQYFQKIGTGDPVCIHYHRGRTGNNLAGSNASELHIFDTRTRAELKVLGITSSTILAGVVDEVTGEQLYTEQFLFTPSSVSELDGKTDIYLELWHYYNGVTPSLYKYRSNPFNLRAVHPYTCLVEFNQSVNGHDILFEQLLPRFAYRIDSNGMSFEPGGDYTVFEDQDRSTVTLDAEAFNIFKWDIGGDHGLPEYMVDIINRSLQCCKDGYFRIDGREYVWSDGKLDNAGGEGKHLQWRTVTLRQKHEPDGYTFTKRKIGLFTAVAFPFAINACVITDNFNYLSVVTNSGYAKVFDDSSGLNTWIGAFNTNIAAAGFASTVVRDGDEVYLLNADGERFGLLLAVKIFPDVLTLTETAVTSGRRYSQYQLFYADTLSHNHVVCYGSTSGSEELKASVNGTNNITVNHEWTTNGSKTVRIFHNNEETQFKSIANTVLSEVSKITNVTGKVSSKLVNFELWGHDFSALTGIDLSFLAPAKNTLIYLILNSCAIDGIVTGWASSLVSGSYKPFWKLTYNEIKGNALTSTAVDNFFNEFYNYCRIANGLGISFIDLSENSPAAPPTGSSGTARTWFSANGWQVRHD